MPQKSEGSDVRYGRGQNYVLVAPTPAMRYLDLDSQTLRVDENAPEPFVRFAKWLRDKDIPPGAIATVVNGVAGLLCTLPEDIQTGVSILSGVIELLLATILDYSITTVHYLSASGQGWALGQGEATITTG